MSGLKLRRRATLMFVFMLLPAGCVSQKKKEIRRA